jgi:serine/threonine-protein kinase
VIVSTGPPAVAIPTVVGADPDAAQSTLRQAGFTPAVTYNVDSNNATQKVSAQRPDGGSNAKKGSTVTIFVSVPGVVPDVTGMTLDDAKRALTAAGYQIGSTAYTADETATGTTVQDGQVVRTEPEAGKPLTPGESVNITIMRSGAGGDTSGQQ